jgi:hypothetical protein
MGVGYQVSALHRLLRLDTAALHQLPKRPIVRGESPLLDVFADLGVKTVAGGPVPIRWLRGQLRFDVERTRDTMAKALGKIRPWSEANSRLESS